MKLWLIPRCRIRTITISVLILISLFVLFYRGLFSVIYALYLRSCIFVIFATDLNDCKYTIKHLEWIFPCSPFKKVPLHKMFYKYTSVSRISKFNVCRMFTKQSCFFFIYFIRIQTCRHHFGYYLNQFVFEVKMKKKIISATIVCQKMCRCNQFASKNCNY